MTEAPTESARPSLTRPARPAEPFVQVMLCLVVAALLLLVIAVPMSRPSESALRAQQVITDLQSAQNELRIAIGEYRYDHGAWPGHVERASGDADIASLVESQLTQCSDASGNTAASHGEHHPFGPYLKRRALPANPVNGSWRVQILGASEPWPEATDAATGWLYRPATGELRVSTSSGARGVESPRSGS